MADPLLPIQKDAKVREDWLLFFASFATFCRLLLAIREYNWIDKNEHLTARGLFLRLVDLDAFNVLANGIG